MKYELVLDSNNLCKIMDRLHTTINKKNIIILLRGEIASGKTTFVKEYLKYIGLDYSVTSPTFCLQNIYGNDIFHYDIYNKTLEEFISLGLLEEFEKEGIHFVEWGSNELEKILLEYGFDIINIEISKLENKRLYKIYA